MSFLADLCAIFCPILHIRENYVPFLRMIIFRDLCHKFWPDLHIREKRWVIFADLCRVFWPISHIRGKMGTLLHFCVHDVFGQFLCCFSGHSAYKGKLCVIFGQFVSCFSGNFAYKGEMWVNLTFLLNPVFFP